MDNNIYTAVGVVLLVPVCPYNIVQSHEPSSNRKIDERVYCWVGKGVFDSLELPSEWRHSRLKDRTLTESIQKRYAAVVSVWAMDRGMDRAKP